MSNETAGQRRALKQAVAVSFSLEQAELTYHILQGAGSDMFFPGADALREHLELEITRLYKLNGWALALPLDRGGTRL